MHVKSKPDKISGAAVTLAESACPLREDCSRMAGERTLAAVPACSLLPSSSSPHTSHPHPYPCRFSFESSRAALNECSRLRSLVFSEVQRQRRRCKGNGDHSYALLQGPWHRVRKVVDDMCTAVHARCAQIYGARSAPSSPSSGPCTQACPWPQTPARAHRARRAASHWRAAWGDATTSLARAPHILAAWVCGKEHGLIFCDAAADRACALGTSQQAGGQSCLPRWWRFLCRVATGTTAFTSSSPSLPSKT